MVSHWFLYVILIGLWCWDAACCHRRKAGFMLQKETIAANYIIAKYYSSSQHVIPSKRTSCILHPVFPCFQACFVTLALLAGSYCLFMPTRTFLHVYVCTCSCAHTHCYPHTIPRLCHYTKATNPCNKLPYPIPSWLPTLPSC
eukprot:jgi/Mesvir1/9328/Mv26064-RA.1